MTERRFQADFIKRLQSAFPGCVVMKNDSGYQQGMLDWTLLYGPNWATLEIKASAKASTQPNQEYFVELLNEMSFAAFVYPENADEVMDALQQAFTSRR